MNDIGVNEHHRIIVIDDNTAIHDDIKKILCNRTKQKAALSASKALLFGEVEQDSNLDEFEIDVALQGEEGLAKVRAAREAGRPYALAFVDVRMPPGWDGVETIKRIWEHDAEIQCVICTAYSDHSWEDIVRIVGRSSSVVILKKPFDNIEVLQLAHALTEKWRLSRQISSRLRDLDQLVEQRTSELQRSNDTLTREIAERTRVQVDLERSEERFSKAFRENPLPLSIHRLDDGSLRDMNPGFESLTGLASSECQGKTLAALGLCTPPANIEDVYARLRRAEPVRDAPCQLTTRSGSKRDVIVSADQFELEGERHFLAVWHDVTERILLERQLRHSQKMEAVGQLAAGIAHDFNNLLTVIQGNASLALSERRGAPEDEILEGILVATHRAAKLVRQLLAFSHKQTLDVNSADVRSLFASISEMLPRIVGEHIQVNVEIAENLPQVSVDSGMIEQMIMNLAVNARDAMPQGGRMTIAASAAEIGADALKANHEARPGRFLRLSVEDTGCGIPPSILPRIFDPFFTTKPVDKGTGLGLSTVYGIVKQHGGWVEVASEVSRGSRFDCYIPIEGQAVARRPASDAAPEPASRKPVTPSAIDKGRNKETVLVVEDEAIVSRLVTKILVAQGYRVVNAGNGKEALKLWEDQGKDIDLLLTDVVMPEGVSGLELASRLVRDKPDLRVILTSGYNRDLGDASFTLPAEYRFIAKPYEFKDLVTEVRSILDSGGKGQDAAG